MSGEAQGVQLHLKTEDHKQCSGQVCPGRPAATVTFCTHGALAPEHTQTLGMLQWLPDHTDPNTASFR